jgi:hypothetical protein
LRPAVIARKISCGNKTANGARPGRSSHRWLPPAPSAPRPSSLPSPAPPHSRGAKQILADRAIGNLQQWLIGTYHGVSRVFRHNRRRQPMAAFQTLLGLGTGRRPTPYELIRGAKDIPKLPAEG